VCLMYAVDRERIAVAGLSAGPSMAALLAARHADRFAAVMMHSGIPPGTASSALSALGAMHGHRATKPMAVIPGGVATAWPPLMVIHGHPTRWSPRRTVAPRPRHGRMRRAPQPPPGARCSGASATARRSPTSSAEAEPSQGWWRSTALGTPGVAAPPAKRTATAADRTRRGWHGPSLPASSAPEPARLPILAVRSPIVARLRRRRRPARP